MLILIDTGKDFGHLTSLHDKQKGAMVSYLRIVKAVYGKPKANHTE